MLQRKQIRAGLAGLASLAAVGLVGSCGNPTEDDPTLCQADLIVCPCIKLLQGRDIAGLQFKADPSTGKVIEVNMGVARGVSGYPSPELAEKFVDCLKAIRPSIEIINYARLNTSPLGQVAHQWNRQSGLKITLRPKNDDENAIINNLQIGPTPGVKWRIIEEWCSDDNMGMCVECSDPNPDRDAVAVEIRLRSNAPVERERWSVGWPKSGNRRPWELIDSEGVRYLYSCNP